MKFVMLDAASAVVNMSAAAAVLGPLSLHHSAKVCQCISRPLALAFTAMLVTFMVFK